MSRKNKPKKQSKQDPIYGEVLAEWDFPEFIQHERSTRWYIVASAIGLGFLLYAILTANYLFAITIIIIGIIIALHHRRDPLAVNFKIVNDGILIDSRFYDFKLMDKFWIVYDPPYVKRLYFTSKAFWKPEYSIPLQDMNPIFVRNILLKFLEEDLEKKEESASDTLSRIIKI